MKMLGVIGRAFLDFCLPPGCALCGAPVAGVGQFCAGCFGQLDFCVPPLCDRCGLPFGAPGQVDCPDCMRVPPPWGRARAAFLYDEAAKKLVLGLKYSGREENAAVLARPMARVGAALLREADLLVPVPLHWSRLVARRYNQAALLAWRLAWLGGKACLPDALARRRKTPALAEKSAVERASLLAGAILVRPARARQLAGRRVLLVDDVLTSGATAAACTAALRGAGATHVDLIVAARVSKAGIA